MSLFVFFISLLLSTLNYDARSTTHQILEIIVSFIFKKIKPWTDWGKLRVEQSKSSKLHFVLKIQRNIRRKCEAMVATFCYLVQAK